MLFNIDTTKADMVDPNDVIKSSSASVICGSSSEISRLLEKQGDAATSQLLPLDDAAAEVMEAAQTPEVPSVTSLVEVGGLSEEQLTVNLSGLPISIIDTSGRFNFMSLLIQYVYGTFF